MIRNPNPNPNLTMIPQSQTLTLTLIVSFLFSSASSLSPSPSPSPSPAETLMSDPIGILRHPPPLLACPSDRIDCLESHHGPHHAAVGAPPVRNENEKLNFGKKIGIVFAAAAILLQVVLGGFLVYKRIQLNKLDQRGSRLVSAPESS